MYPCESSFSQVPPLFVSGCFDATGPSVVLFGVLGATASATPSLQPFGATLFSSLAALRRAILMFCIAQFDDLFVIAVLSLSALDTFSLGENLGEINVAWACPVAKAAFHAGLQSQVSCGRPGFGLSKLKQLVWC
tara:strand:- start:1786 stop:2190 length:405 start_codon:yes stop_codon:yes gene_type:complete